MLRKIVSGGQTGADRAALDVALDLGLEIGGWIPKGRWSEDGPICARYEGLQETDSADPSVRTTLNLRDSDATLIVSHGPLDAGSLLTLEEARRVSRPVLHLDLAATGQAAATKTLRDWLHKTDPSTLNVAGPRASYDPRVYAETTKLLQTVIAQVVKAEPES